eukprot:scaffold27996_cov79-Isochrysis_galbana.AAC.1
MPSPQHAAPLRLTPPSRFPLGDHSIHPSRGRQRLGAARGFPRPFPRRHRPPRSPARQPHPLQSAVQARLHHPVRPRHWPPHTLPHAPQPPLACTLTTFPTTSVQRKPRRHQPVPSFARLSVFGRLRIGRFLV